MEQLQMSSCGGAAAGISDGTLEPALFNPKLNPNPNLNPNPDPDPNPNPDPDPNPNPNPSPNPSPNPIPDQPRFSGSWRRTSTSTNATQKS